MEILKNETFKKIRIRQNYIYVMYNILAMGGKNNVLVQVVIFTMYIVLIHYIALY